MLRSVCTASCPIPRHEPQLCLFHIPSTLSTSASCSGCCPTSSHLTCPHCNWGSPGLLSLVGQFSALWSEIDANFMISLCSVKCSFITTFLGLCSVTVWADSGYVHLDERGCLLWGRNLRLCVLSMCHNPDDCTLAINHLSPVMKCDCYSKVLASTFDSISVPLQILLDCVDSWEKPFSCKFATCDAGIMAGWLGVQQRQRSVWVQMPLSPPPSLLFCLVFTSPRCQNDQKPESQIVHCQVL